MREPTALRTPHVALRKESVDRNIAVLRPIRSTPWSLSARRAWIEIFRTLVLGGWGRVALRKESVDRNSTGLANIRVCITSLSARRAWIEICSLLMFWLFRLVALRKESVDRNPVSEWRLTGYLVALRKESVDRNLCVLSIYQSSVSRSPQGERG